MRWEEKWEQQAEDMWINEEQNDLCLNDDAWSKFMEMTKDANEIHVLKLGMNVLKKWRYYIVYVKVEDQCLEILQH